MSNENTDLSIVIPCFNESKNVTVVLNCLKDYVDQSEYSLEIIVIDGGSTDNTQEELKKIYQNLPQKNFKLILKDSPGGYGGDIMYALSQAGGEVLAWTHADLQTDPLDVIKAYEHCRPYWELGESIFLKGQRKNRRFLEFFFTFGMQIVAWWFLKVYLSDINAQPKMFSREFYNKHLRQGHPLDFSLDLYALFQAKKQRYSIITIPVYFKKRVHGEAKGGGGEWKMRLKLIRRTFKYIVELKKSLADE